MNVVGFLGAISIIATPLGLLALDHDTTESQVSLSPRLTSTIAPPPTSNGARLYGAAATALTLMSRCQAIAKIL